MYMYVAFYVLLIQETARMKPRDHPPNRKTVIKVADANSTTKNVVDQTPVGNQARKKLSILHQQRGLL